MRVWVVVALAALVVPAAANAGTVFVLGGHGWGHGVGMSQWGAEGYALHGYDYRRILAHYYPHTTLQLHRSTQVRVLLREKQSRIRITSPAPYLVVDAKGRKRHLRSGVVLTPKLLAHWHGFTPPLRFEAGIQPLTLGGDGYRGDLVVKPRAGGLMVVNVLPLDRYLRGVVPWEVPAGWQQAAYEAQAVAARSYTLATLHPGEDFDLYPDQRDQMYGGIRAERRETNLALGATAGQVLTYGGRPIVAYYSSTSGGRTASAPDGLGAPAEPYLVSVPDPYDSISPHHVWPTRALTSAYLAHALGLPGVRSAVTVPNSSGRAAVVRFLTSRGWVSIDGQTLRHELDLQSTYFNLGTLTIDRPPRRALLASSKVRVTGSVSSLANVQLEQETRDGAWRTAAYVHPHNGRFVVTLRAKAPLTFRLVASGVATAPISYRLVRR